MKPPAPTTAESASPAPPSSPRVVLVDDGGLDDVAALLAELRVDVARIAPEALRDGRTPRPEPGAIVVARARVLLGLEASLHALGPSARVAIADGGSRTARARLRRAGVDFLVGRPAHPDVLRLFFARLVYRGPEKRFAPRLAVGLPVALRSRLRRRAATLIELSRTGAQVVSDHAFGEGSRLTLYLPHPTLPREFSLPARVVRRTAADAPARFGLGLALEARTAGERADLAALLAAHAQGPSAPAGVSASAAPGAGAQPDESRERRVGGRRAFAEPLLACSDLGARVVMGRDLSPGGLRVEGVEGLEVGRIVTLVLHDADTAHGPISVRAHVARATRDGDRVLRFIGLDAETRRRIARLVEAPAAIQSLVGTVAQATCVVTEIAGAG